MLFPFSFWWKIQFSTWQSILKVLGNVYEEIRCIKRQNLIKAIFFLFSIFEEKFTICHGFAVFVRHQTREINDLAVEREPFLCLPAYVNRFGGWKKRQHERWRRRKVVESTFTNFYSIEKSFKFPFHFFFLVQSCIHYGMVLRWPNDLRFVFLRRWEHCNIAEISTTWIDLRGECKKSSEGEYLDGIWNWYEKNWA